MERASPTRAGVCNPAAYGQACAGCSRAKCKCFYQADGSGCERCSRLGKVCEPSLSVRRRRPHRERRSPPRPSATRLEDKLDDLVSLLRAQASDRQGQISSETPQTLSSEADTPSSLVSGAPGAFRNPDVVIDTSSSFVNILRPFEELAGSMAPPSPIHSDVSVHNIPWKLADAQLETFRRSFLTTFPFVHISTTTTASDLRRKRPFLWLVIMALSTNQVSQQFAMGETIWQIVSRRVVAEHYVDLDVLLGLICFSAWSHYFKKDKPFMTMLTQIAVSLTFELCLHKDTSTGAARFRRNGRLLTQALTTQQSRTVEDRRTVIAVFILAST
ncbi:hypothetical protein GQ53DRAFT_666369 [Thozetella sp. PMI_491]|nr:hypothetical protein GQ53DRAFT_666369 [Thozetella sp. PMI_491]